MSFLRRPTPSGGPQTSASFVDTDFQRSLPALHEYLTSPQYPDGTPRVTASLSVFHEDGLWKACLNERDTGMVLFVAEDRFATLTEALELLLQEERPPWRPSRSKGHGGAKGKGKGS